MFICIYIAFLEFCRIGPLAVLKNLKERNTDHIKKMDQLLKATAIESVPAFGLPIFTTALLRLLRLGLMRRELNYREVHDEVPADEVTDPYDEEVLNEERLIVDCNRMLQYCFTEIDLFGHLKQALLSLALAFPVERSAHVDYVELNGSSSAALMQVFELVHQTLPLTVDLLKSCGFDFEQTLSANTQTATQLVSLYCFLVRSMRPTVERLGIHLMSHIEDPTLHPTPEEIVAIISNPPDTDAGDRESYLYFSILRVLEQTEANLILSPTIVQNIALLIYPLDVRSFASIHAAIVHRYKDLVDMLTPSSEDEQREANVINQLVLQFAYNRLHYVRMVYIQIFYCISMILLQYFNMNYQYTPKFPVLFAYSLCST